jgi:Zn2+/Cd2+-exporting ATPase
MADNEATEIILKVKGMDCASCATTVQTGVARLEGVEFANLSFATETLRVRGDVDVERVAHRVRELGYDIAEAGEDDPRAAAAAPQSFRKYLLARRATALALLGAVLILPGLLFNELLPGLGYESPWLDLTSLAAMVAAGGPIARSAWRSLRINREININVLMTIAAIGAVFIGAVTEAGLVMVLFAIGEALEGYTADRARNSIRELMTLLPQEATVLRPCIDCASHLGQEGYEGGPCPFCSLEPHRVSVDDLEIGETIVVRPGERIAMDGRVVQGESLVNQAPITGESRLILKEPGSETEVFASSVNGAGVLHVEVTRRAEDNTISRIIQMVEEAQEKRAPAQRFVDRFARVYTPAVVVLAVLVAAVPPLFFGQPFLSTEGSQGWLYRALALLVVACPCALVISTPVSLISAISNAARHGVLVKGGAYLEVLSQVRAIAFDKTGTLTRGEPVVVDVQSMACEAPGKRCVPCDELLALAGAVEQYSEHPLAQAVRDAAASRGVNGRYTARDVHALAGRGVAGQINGDTVVVGSHRYFEDHFPHAADTCDTVDAASAAGQTTLLVGRDGSYLGYITVADQVRSSSWDAVAALHNAGIEHVVMLTGDDAATAAAVAGTVGVDDVRAGLMPAAKVDAVEALQRQYGTVAMVGDGINDAPALATASVGIAMGAAGTAQALETADVALMGDDLGLVAFLLRLSRATMNTIWANIALSIGIKVAFLILVLLGRGSLWLAVFADMGASLLVTLNGMRLLHRPRPDAARSPAVEPVLTAPAAHREESE